MRSGSRPMSDLRVGELAAAAGVNRETLRYYERRGLIAEPPRSLGGHRLYDERLVTTLRVIKAAQRLGFSLNEVADLLTAGEHRHGRRPAPGLQNLAVSKLAEVEQKIADLEVIRGSLAAALDAGCNDLLACASSSCCPIPFAALDTNAPPVSNSPTGENTCA